MSAVRLFTDEDVYSAVALAMCRAGYDAISSPTSGRLNVSDESQLEWAASEGRVLVTFNVGHFAALHATWLRQGRQHAGLVLSSQRPIGDTVRRLLHLSNMLTADLMVNRLEYLGDW